MGNFVVILLWLPTWSVRLLHYSSKKGLPILGFLVSDSL